MIHYFRIKITNARDLMHYDFDFKSSSSYIDAWKEATAFAISKLDDLGYYWVIEKIENIY